jgi:hypothetical protein
VNKVNYGQTSIIIDRFAVESAACDDSAKNADVALEDGMFGSFIFSGGACPRERAEQVGPLSESHTPETEKTSRFRHASS